MTASTHVFGTVRSSVVSGIGVLGGAITLFGNLDAVLSLADWARWLVDHWHTWLHTFWKEIFDLLNIRDDAGLRLDLTFTVFLITTAVGSRLEVMRSTPNGAITGRPSFRTLLRTALFLALALIGYVSMAVAINVGIMPNIYTAAPAGAFVFGVALWSLLYLAVAYWPTPEAIGTATLLEAFLFLQYAHVSANPEPFNQPLWLSAAILGLGGLFAFWIAVPSKFHVRLWFMAGGVVVLAALNFLASLHLTLR